MLKGLCPSVAHDPLGLTNLHVGTPLAPRFLCHIPTLSSIQAYHLPYCVLAPVNKDGRLAQKLHGISRYPDVQTDLLPIH